MKIKNEVATWLLFALVVISVLPLEPFRFHAVYLSTLIFGSVIFFLERKTGSEIYRVLFALTLVGICALFQVNDAKTLYDLRDLIRWVPVILLLDYTLVNRDVFSKRVFWFISVCTLFDIFVLFAAMLPDLRQSWYAAATTQEMANYIDGYYRHIGILGNPNASSLLYVIFLLWLIHFVAQLSGKIRRVLGGMLILANLVLLLGTVSRTGIISLAVALLLTRPRYLYYYLLLLIGMVGMLVLVGDNFFDIVFGRFFETTGYSAATERMDMSHEIIGEALKNGFWYGGVKQYEVTDNDYVTLLTRFGVIGAISFIVIFFGHEVKKALQFRIAKPLHLQLLVVTLLSSVVGGVIGSPGLFIIALILMRIT